MFDEQLFGETVVMWVAVFLPFITLILGLRFAVEVLFRNLDDGR